MVIELVASEKAMGCHPKKHGVVVLVAILSGLLTHTESLTACRLGVQPQLGASCKVQTLGHHIWPTHSGVFGLGQTPAVSIPRCSVPECVRV